MTGLCLMLSAVMLLQSTPPMQPITPLKDRAESGDVKAQLELGMAYATGNGIAADDAEAVKWFRKAAEKGDAAGEYSLSEMYLTGRRVGQPLIYLQPPRQRVPHPSFF